MTSKLFIASSFFKYLAVLGLTAILVACDSGSDRDSAITDGDNPPVVSDTDTSDTGKLQNASVAKICSDRGISLNHLDDSAGLDKCLAEIIRTQGLQNGSIEDDVRTIRQQAEDIKRQLPLSDPLVSLGQRLFFNKNLGGNFDTSCGTCHDPRLAGTDALSLAIGISADDPDLLGPGRTNLGGATALPNEPRHALSIFNVGLHEHPGRGLLWDMRIEPLGSGAISSPDSAFNTSDTNAQEFLDDASQPSLIDALVATLAGFPITDPGEMRGTTHPLLGSLNPDTSTDNALLRHYLAGRFRSAEFMNESESLQLAVLEQEVDAWQNLFAAAFPQQASAELDELISFPNIARAISAYVRQQIYIDNPWYQYVLDETEVLTNSAKRGAILFYTPASHDPASPPLTDLQTINSGADCARCHGGATFSIPDQNEDPSFVRRVGFPQIGEGRGCPNSSDPTIKDSNDCGRHNVSGDANDLFKFRVPTLLNIQCTKPYGHTGPFASLDQVIQFFDEPHQVAASYFSQNRICELPQFKSVGMSCENLLAAFPDGLENTMTALGQPGESDLREIDISDEERKDLVQFLHALTDPAACESLSPENLRQLPASDGRFVNQLDADVANMDGNVNIVDDQLF